MQGSAGHNRERNTDPILVAVIGIALLALVGQTWWAIEQDYELTMAAHARSSAAVTRTYGRQVEQIIEQADRSIVSVSKMLGDLDQGSSTNPEHLRQTLIRARSSYQPLEGLWLMVPQSQQWVTLMRIPETGADYSANSAVQYLAEHPEHRYPVIGELQTHDDKNSIRWSLPIVRNLYGADGQRTAIIGASLNTAYLADFHAQANPSEDMIIAWHSGDKVLLVGSPFDIRLTDSDAPDSPLMRQLRNGAMAGWIQDFSPFSGERMFFAYRRHDSLPLTTLYATDAEKILDPWKARSFHRIALTLAALFFLSILGWLLLRQMRHLRKSQRELLHSQNRYRVLFENAIDGIFLIDRNQVYVDCNSAGVRLFGAERKEQIIGRTPDHFTRAAQSPANFSPEERQRKIDAALAGKPQQYELAAWRNGRLQYTEVTLSQASTAEEELVLIIHRDITRRRMAEQLQEDQNRVLHSLASGADLQVVLNEVVRFNEQRNPSAQAAILLLNENGSRFITGIGPSLPQEILEQMVTTPIDSNSGIASETMLARCPVLVEDIALHPSTLNGHEVLTSHGFASCGGWPVMGKRGQLLGVFVLLYRARGLPTADEVQMVAISCDLAGIAIESRYAEDRIRQLAHYDELTGLPNRFLYTQHLNKAVAHAARRKTPVAVFFLDLDRFKNINDTFGHEAGDKVLRDIAAGFKSCLRESDIIARVGGDEFIALIDDFSGLDQLQDIAQRLLAAATQPFDIDGHECQLSASIGIATYPDDGLDSRMLLKNADIAMYRAKESGRNNFQFYSAGMNSHSVERMALESSLRRAVERQEFVVHYQPRVDITTGRIVGAEALVRWRHPEKGLVLPGEFIPIAEETGLISQIGLQVLDIACRDIHIFDRTAIPLGRIAINLSMMQFNDPNLLRDVQRVITARQIDPGRLEFEITESMVMHNHEQVIHLMQKIREMGFSLAIDDFGTGYSSLAYLKRLPVDSVKVDQSFVMDIPEGQKDSGIVQAIIGMAHTLGLKVVAEGVEMKRQLDALQEFGCDQYQGFYMSKAVPPDQFVRLMQHQPVLQPTAGSDAPATPAAAAQRAKR